jgi:hypothetical protein
MCIALCLHGKPGVQWRCMVAWMAIPLHSHLSTLHMKRNHSTKRKTNHQHGIVSFATKSCIAHPRRAVVGHFDPSAEPRVPDRRQARTGARMWPAHKSRAGLRNQSRVVCTRDLTLPGRYVVKFCVAVIMSPALATRGLNKACSNLPNSQMLVYWSSPGEALQAGNSSKGQASCYL